MACKCQNQVCVCRLCLKNAFCLKRCIFAKVKQGETWELMKGVGCMADAPPNFILGTEVIRGEGEEGRGQKEIQIGTKLSKRKGNTM